LHHDQTFNDEFTQTSERASQARQACKVSKVKHFARRAPNGTPKKQPKIRKKSYGSFMPARRRNGYRFWLVGFG